MKIYIRKLLLRHVHPVLPKGQLLPHSHVEINYGTKSQYSTEPAYRPPLDDDGVKHIQ